MVHEWLPADLLNELAARPLDADFSLREIVHDPEEPLHASALAAIDGLPDSELEEVRTDPRLGASIDYIAGPRGSDAERLFVTARVASREVFRRRCKALQSRHSLAEVFAHPALAGLQPDAEGLVPLSEFDVSERRIERSGFVFHVVPPLPQVNSGYWFGQALLSRADSHRAWIRLDPFLICPAESYSSVFYRMFVYGQNLDWGRIAKLRTVEHAQWLPDELSSKEIGRTDIQWSPRDGLVHFECEELPTAATERPARYFHSIYDPAREVFVHSDFAVRFYSREGLASREQKHLKDLDKVGLRIKLLRIDDSVSPIDWGTLLAASLVWNNDLARYVTARREFLPEYSTLLPGGDSS